MNAILFLEFGQRFSDPQPDGFEEDLIQPQGLNMVFLPTDPSGSLKSPFFRPRSPQKETAAPLF